MSSPYEGSTNRITRNQGYAANAHKEAEGKVVFLSLMEHLGLDITEITDMTTQINLGDYRDDKNRYHECKSQNIGAYAKNFVEVGEYLPSTSDKHRGGHTLTSEWLRSHGIDLYDCNIRQRYDSKATQKFGNPEFYNPGITPAIRGACVWYINRTSTLIYLYRPETFQRLVIDEIKNDRLFWGATSTSRANETTICVFIQNSPAAWQKVKGKWRFLGSQELEEEVLDYLKGN